MEILIYLIIGWFIGGCHFAWAWPRLPKAGYLDLLSPEARLVAFCGAIIGPFWPGYLAMMLGARAFRNYAEKS